MTNVPTKNTTLRPSGRGAPKQRLQRISNSHRLVVPCARIALVGAVAIGTAACGAAPEAEAEPVASTSAAIVGTVIGSWTDWSGSVSIRLYRCPANFVSTGANSASCSVDSNYAIVGGGPEICSVNP